MSMIVVIGGASFAFGGENKVYVFVEKTAVGFGLGHLLATSVNSFRTLGLVSKISKGNYVAAVPILLGLLFLFRLSKNYQFVAKYPATLILGVGIGLGVRTCIRNEILKQIGSTISLPLASPRTLVILAILILVFSMFMFAEKVGKYFEPLRTPGRCLVMLALGTLLANQLVDALNQMSTVAIKKMLEVFLRV
jgi:hypothetical protein